MTRGISPVTTAVLAAWIVVVMMLQWVLYGPFIDIGALTGLSADAAKTLVQWRDLLRSMLTAELGT